MALNEVAPPGWGHTKAEKEKTKPDKPKSKIGGSAAAFKRALDDGRFKGLPGDKTKKEKTASMFKLMWSMKKKGDKPHYKPGTDKKYKKYQEEVVLEKDLNAKERRALPNKDFVFPGKGEGPEGKQRGAYPIPDKKHARNALAMAAAHASPEKQAKVRAAVKKKFPDIEVNEEDDYKVKNKELKRTENARNQRYKTLHTKTDQAGNVDVNERYDNSESRAKESQKFHTFYKKAQEAKARKQADSTRSDSRIHGIKFSDAKGTGRIRGGKKIYD